MSVASDIILISIKAIQSNGILSYTLNIFKTRHLLKSTQLFTRSKNLSATWNRLVNAKGKMISTCATLNEMHMCRSKWDAHAQAKMRCTCVGQIEMRTCRPKSDAHAQTKIRCACAGQNEMRVRRPKWDADAQVKMRCACAGQNELRMRRSKWDAHAQL